MAAGKDNLEPTLGKYWPTRHDLAMIDIRHCSNEGQMMNHTFFITEADTRLTIQQP